MVGKEYSTIRHNLLLKKFTFNVICTMYTESLATNMFMSKPSPPS